MALHKPRINTGENILGKMDTSNLLLLNAYYNRPNRKLGIPDFCTVVYKDTSTGEKHKMEIENPLMRMYVVKDEYLNTSFYPEFLPRSKCDEWIVPYNEVLYHISKLAGPYGKKLVEYCRNTGNYYSLNKLHHYPGVLGTDFPYENYFRIEWMLHYANPKIDTRITKQYMDIEVDSIDIKGMPSDGDCPINAITMIDQETKTSFTFVLRNPKNPQIEAFEKDISNFIDELHEAFDESYGSFDYRIYMFDDELEMLKQFFTLVNNMKRDFMLIWNLSFDIPYIMARLIQLGVEPWEVMCSKDFKYPYCWFRKDRAHFDYKSNKDLFRCASYTIYRCQMKNYAKVRKGQAEIPSYRLTSIAKREIGDEKLDYSDEANIKTLAYVDFRKFIMYNIKDVLLQYGIENKCKDLETIFLRAYENATDYDSVFSQTIFLKNCVFMEYYRGLDLIKGNNINLKYDRKEDDAKASDDDDEDKYELDEDGNPDWTKPKTHGFEGALVGNPLNNGHVGDFIYGKQSKFIFSYVIDFDFSSLYPSIIISHNIGQNPLVGKVILNTDKWRHINQDPLNAYFDPAKDLFDDFMTRNYSKTGKKWFNLPTLSEILEELDETNTGEDGV